MSADIWVCAELDTKDGGRGWMAAATTPEAGKNLCADRYLEEALNTYGVPAPTPLVWTYLEFSPIFGQPCWTAYARTPHNSTEFYDVRRLSLTMGDDWTASPASVSNDSPLYLDLIAEVDRLIREGAHSLITGHSAQVARLIVSHLAHGRGLAPYGQAQRADR